MMLIILMRGMIFQGRRMIRMKLRGFKRLGRKNFIKV